MKSDEMDRDSHIITTLSSTPHNNSLHHDSSSSPSVGNGRCTCASNTQTPVSERFSWRRRLPRTQTNTSTLLLLTICFISCTLFSPVSATPNVLIQEQMIEPAIEARTELLASTFARLARSGTILVDQSPPPAPVGVSWTPDQRPRPASDTKNNLDDHDLLRRGASSSTSLSATTPAPSASSTVYDTIAASSTVTLTKSASSMTTLAPTTTAGIAASTDTSGPLPTPFDVGFGNNITSSCQSFMTSMLSNQTFKDCLPFSLLLQNSNSFFQTSKSLVRITQLLDYTCSAPLPVCSNLLTSYARNLTSTSNCNADLTSQNPIITQAHLGLLAYPTLYTASCLRNPSTSSYCFGEAITNATSPTDSYIYFLPLNTSLVGGSQPTCDSCLKQTMGVFEQATSQRSSAIFSTYGSAAEMINLNCGPNFVNASLAPAVSSATMTRISFDSSTGVLALGLLLGSWLLS